MAKQIKKKFIADDAIDGVKLLLEQDQTLRRLLQDGSEQDVIAYLEGLVGAEEARALAAEGVLQDAIDAEESARQAADDALQSDISAETSAREAAVSTEESARQAADDALQSDISAETSAREAAVSAEESARIAGDDSLQSDISAETSAREAAVSAEESARIAGDDSLQSDISAETSARQAADSSLETALQSNISTEESARIAADSSLQSQIDQIRSNTDPAALDSLSEIVDAFQSADGDLSEAITAVLGTHTSELNTEVSARQAADSALQSNISTEESARQAADSVLQSAIDDEESARQAADADLQSKLDVETVRARSAEEDLQSALSAEESARQSADTSLQSALSAEESARQSADTSLQSAVSAEVSARQSADTSLQSAISDEEARALAAEGVLQDAIDAEESARIAGDTKILDSIKKEVLFETEAQIMGVAPDETAPIANPSNASDEGWFFDKSLPESGNKINWYFHYKSQAPVHLDENGLSVYFTSVVENGYIFLGMYTSPEGDGNDASSWYRSRLVMTYDNAEVTLGQEYLFWAFNEPSADIRPELTRVELTINPGSSVGPAEAPLVADGTRISEMFDRIAINTDSADSATKVRVYDAGIQGEKYEKEIAFRIKDRVTLDEVMSLALQKSSMDAQRSEYLKLYTDYLHGLQQASIDAEVARATAAEQVNANAIAVLNGDSSVEGSVAKSIADVIDAAPEALDTLNELAAAINDDASFAASVTQQITDAKNELKGSVSEAFDTMKEIEDEFTKINGDSSVEGSVDYKVAAEAVLRSNADADLQSQIDQINTDVSAVVQFGKESFTVSQADLDAGYIDLAAEAKSNSIVMFVDRLAMHEGAVGDVCDYSVSVVGGVTRITFESEMVTPAPEALEVGQVIRVTYAK